VLLQHEHQKAVATITSKTAAAAAAQQHAAIEKLRTQFKCVHRYRHFATAAAIPGTAATAAAGGMQPQLQHCFKPLLMAATPV
jgi:hypothetical protein